MNLSSNVKITMVKAAAASAGTELLSDVIDMSGYDGVIFFGTIATANAGNYMKGQQDVASPMTSPADLEGSKVVATGNGEVVWLDIYQPRERYVRVSVIRAGTNTITGDIYAIQYKGRKFPETNLTTDVILGKLLIAPAEGTA